MLRRGDHVPHFSIRDLDGHEVAYDLIWQRQNLLLTLIDPGDPDGAVVFADHLRGRLADLTAHDTACVVTGDAVAGAPSPGIVIADRWGEIWHVQQAESNRDLPDADALIEWLRYVQMQCPECQGESK
jgi:hypothetical protein